jgi:hypothetical protein
VVGGVAGDRVAGVRAAHVERPGRGPDRREPAGAGVGLVLDDEQRPHDGDTGEPVM